MRHKICGVGSFSDGYNKLEGIRLLWHGHESYVSFLLQLVVVVVVVVESER